MISYLSGALHAIMDEKVIIDLGPIALETIVSNNTKLSLPALGSSCTLFTYLSVREDAIQLYGFATQGERNVFLALIRVSGIGPKAAINILSKAKPENICQAILEENEAFLTSIPGVGKKTASRLLLELKEKISPEKLLAKDSGLKNDKQNSFTIFYEAEAALLSLGFQRKQVSHAISVTREEGFESLTTQNIIKRALKILRES